MAYDLSGNKVTLAPVEFKKIQQTIQDVVTNLDAVGQGHNKLTDDVQTNLNNLQGQVDGLTSLTAEEVKDIQSKLTTLNEIIGTGKDEANFLDIIDITNKLVDTVNIQKNTIVSQFRFNAEGVLKIDLSAFSFDNISQYEIMATLNGGVVAPVTLSVEKVDKATAKVYARDLRYFAELNQPYTDAAVTKDDGNGGKTYPNAFDITLLVSFTSTGTIKKLGRTPTAA